MNQGPFRILIVEDEVFVGLNLSMQLEDEGFSILGPVNTVDAAEDILRAESPDFAILDANLGGHRPTSVARRLVERDIPFVYVSGYGRDYITQHLPEAPLIQKPVRFSLLIAEIRAHLNTD